MIGLPSDRTLVESGLKAIGLAGAGLGVVIMILVAGGMFISLFIDAGGMLFFNTLPLFFVGAIGVATGLGLAASGQALATFRLLAHNTHSGDTSS